MTDLGRLVHGLGALRGGDGPPRLLAVGWATVDLERTLADLEGTLAVPDPTVAEPGATDAAAGGDEPLLGARARRLDAGRVTVIVLEPITEGRLAAALARRGEGICALYLAAEGTLEAASSITALGLPGRLLPHDQPWGPFVIEVQVATERGMEQSGSQVGSR